LASEKGIVTKIGAKTAWVQTTKSSSCASCSARGSCNPLAEGKEMNVEAINSVGAKVGDRILLNIATSSLLKASFLLYVFPVLCLLAGAIVGQRIAMMYDLNESAFSALSAFLFFFVAFVLIRSKGNKLSEMDKYKPEIIRIIKHH